MATKNELSRKRTCYAGRVQGVGFRFTTQQVADRYEVSGYVKNLPDGRVEVVAEGAADELERFLAGIEQAMGRHIQERQSQTAPATGEFEGFSIRY